MLPRKPLSLKTELLAVSGFTLIELSIVLVIIGLIVGGILTGQDLIQAASIRAQISQIEKYNTAVYTFRNKYGELPGDISAAAVSQFGFTVAPTRAGTQGQGDGDGELDGYSTTGPTAYSWNQSGENLWFWEDLSSNGGGLIEGSLNSYNSGNLTCSSISTCKVYLPYAKIGNSNFIYTYSGYAIHSGNTHIGPNFFGLAIINSMLSSNVSAGSIPPAPGLTVLQAYRIDQKTDDGFPTKGNVIAQYLTSATGQPGWSANGASPNASTCYDTSTGTASYSLYYNNGGGTNCGISFQMK